MDLMIDEDVAWMLLRVTSIVMMLYFGVRKINGQVSIATVRCRTPTSKSNSKSAYFAKSRRFPPWTDPLKAVEPI